MASAFSWTSERQNNHKIQDSLYIMTCLLFMCTSLQRHGNSHNCHIFTFDKEGNFDLPNLIWQWLTWKSQIIPETKPFPSANWADMRSILSCGLKTRKLYPVSYSQIYKYRHPGFPPPPPKNQYLHIYYQFHYLSAIYSSLDTLSLSFTQFGD